MEYSERIRTHRTKQEYISWIRSQNCDWMHVVIHCIPENGAGLGSLQNGPIVKALQWTNCSVERALRNNQPLKKIATWGGDKASNIAPHIHMMIEKPAAGVNEYRRLFISRFQDNAQKAFRNRKINAKVNIFEVSEAESPTDPLVCYVLRPEDEKYGSGLDKVIDKACYLQ